MKGIALVDRNYAWNANFKSKGQGQRKGNIALFQKIQYK